jgi:hypothetical protein
MPPQAALHAFQPSPSDVLVDDISEWAAAIRSHGRMAPEMAAGRTTVGTFGGGIVAVHLCLAISHLVAGALTSES